MKSLIIYAHPYNGSFNNYVKSLVIDLIKEKDEELDVIDLNGDNFNPVMTKDDLKLFSKGEYHDPLALKYVEMLKNADNLILIFPIWWYGEPAILKGFYDKVLLKGHTYDDSNKIMKGLLNIKKATILTTGTIDENMFAHFGNPILNVVANGILKAVGINDVDWIHCPMVHIKESRDIYLERIHNYFK